MKRKHKILISIFTVFMLCVLTISAQTSPIYNLSFEKKGINLAAPLNWEAVGNAHDISLDSANSIDEKYSLSVKSKSGKANTNDAFLLTNRIRAKPFIGSNFKLSGNIRTLNCREGYAQLYVIVQKNGLTIQSVYSWEQRITGTTDWTKNEISIKIDSLADDIVLGMMFRGSRQAWFDDLKIYRNDVLVDEEKIYPAKLNAAEQDWLNLHIIPLPTMVSSKPEEQPDWNEYFGDAKIIGLGEFSHTTSEVFTAKAGIIKSLISKNQLKIIAWESGFAEAEIFNKCLQTKGCDVKSSFKKMITGPWNNAEVLDLLQWIQNYNATAEKPVQFVGFDMQKYKTAFDRLMHFAAAKNNKLLINRLEKYQYIQEKNYKINSNYTINNHKISNQLKSEAIKLKEAFYNINDSVWIKQYAELLYQSGITWASGFADAMDLRDSFMALNFIYMQSQNPNEKMAIWAHNAHISNRKSWFGSYLKNKYGADYKIVGFSSRQGNFSSWKNTPIILVEPDQRCYEYFFPRNNFLLPLKEAQNNKAETNWLNTEMLFRNSVNLSDQQFDPTVLAKEFDFIYHIENTSGSKDY